jgi:hypothetical protein
MMLVDSSVADDQSKASILASALGLLMVCYRSWRAFRDRTFLWLQSMFHFEGQRC